MLKCFHRTWVPGWGRYKEIYIQALNYVEFLEFFKLPDSDESLQRYIEVGGLPGLARHDISDMDDVRSYQNDVYNTILLKDIVLRHSIRNVTFLDNLVRFVADNIGKQISANSIARYMKHNGDNVTVSLVINYLKYMTEAYMVARAARYDIHGKKIFESNDKFYFEDIGIRNALVPGSRARDIE